MTTAGSPLESGSEARASAATRPAGPSGRSLSLEGFVALNDEIRAFVRAGIPLDVGLAGTAVHSEGLLREVAARIAAQTAEGASLAEAIDAEGPRFPAEYRALLAAGLRTGRLPEALATVSELSASIARLRRQLRLSLIYPAIVFALAFGLLVGLMMFVVPQLRRTREVFSAEPSASVDFLSRLSETVGIWGIGVPALCVGIWLLRWIGRHLFGARARPLDGVRWLPGAREARIARFAQILSVLVEYSVPLPEGLRLSGQASGSAKLKAGAEQLAGGIESGDDLQTAINQARGLPALLRWLMGIGLYQGSLAGSLQQAAGIYERRALARLERFRRLAPPAIVLALGGLVTTGYALSVFIPLTELLQSLEEVAR